MLPCVNFSINRSSVHITITNSTLTGLNQFQISKVNPTVQNGTLTFTMIYPKLVATGQHSANGSMSESQFSGAGPFNVTANSKRRSTVE